MTSFTDSVIYFSLILFSVLGSSIAEQTSNSQRNVVIDLSVGKLRGKIEPVPGVNRDVDVFLGIPFAEPPVGELRFANPRPAKPWTGVRDATKHAARCSYGQVMPPMAAVHSKRDSFSEDCLFLNVFRPANTKATKDLPVMFFIHGGGFYRGSGNMYDGSPLAANNDVIVVVMSYRLGLFGFLHVAGTDVKGNYAMLDQVLALKWVQQHIGCFGGDPNQVTVFGESAGGASVMLLSLSPLSKGLFKKAILESATETYGLYPFNRTRIYLDRLGCQDNDNALACLRSKTTQDILDAQGPTDYLFLGGVFPVPVVDGYFLEKDPDVMIAEGDVHKLDSVIIGVNNNEGGFHWHGVMKSQDSEPSREMFENSVRSINFTKKGDCDAVKAAIFFQYTNHSAPDDPSNVLRNWQKLVTDYRFFAPAVRMANGYAKAGIPTYFYHFSHWSSFSKRPEKVGVVHFDEIPYVFGVPWKPSEDICLATGYTDVEQGLSTLVMRMWGHFAKYGSPVDPNSHPKQVTWPLYTAKSQEYLDINLVTGVHNKLHAHRMAFWNELIPKLTLQCEKCDKQL